MPTGPFQSLEFEGYNAARHAAINPESDVFVTASEKPRGDTRHQFLGAAPPDYYSVQLGDGYLHPRYWPTWIVLGLLRLCVFLPFAVCRFFGTGYGLLFYLFNSKRRRVARINLAMCFPDRNGRDRARMLRRHFLLTGQGYADLGFLAWASEARIERKTRFVGLEKLRAQIDRGKNIILLAPHCVGLNFGTLLAKDHAQFSMFKPPRSVVLNWFLNKGRMRFGCRLLMRNQGLRPVLRALQQGVVFYYIPDEDFGRGRSAFAPFFGVQTATLMTLGRLANLTDAVVLPYFVRLLPHSGGYELTIKSPLENFPTGDRIADAARMNAVLEHGIREMPEQYMWTFKFFKTRPDNAPSPYT